MQLVPRVSFATGRLIRIEYTGMVIFIIRHTIFVGIGLWFRITTACPTRTTGTASWCGAVDTTRPERVVCNGCLIRIVLARMIGLNYREHRPHPSRLALQPLPLVPPSLSPPVPPAPPLPAPVGCGAINTTRPERAGLQRVLVSY